MGIDIAGLRFLDLVAETMGGFGRTATLGRQELHVARIGGGLRPKRPSERRRAVEYLAQDWAQRWGVSSITSVDASPYEGADVIIDLASRPSNPIDEVSFDTVIDLGTLEHIFDPVAALDAVGMSLAPGGRAIHVVPSNQSPGHGLFQFSPDFFTCAYSRARGFSDVRVFLSTVDKRPKRYEVHQNDLGRRVEFKSRKAAVVCVVATLSQQGFRMAPAYQTDYGILWAERAAGKHSSTPSTSKQSLGSMRRFLMQHPAAYDFATSMYALGQSVTRRRSLGRSHSDLSRVY